MAVDERHRERRESSRAPCGEGAQVDGDDGDDRRPVRAAERRRAYIKPAVGGEGPALGAARSPRSFVWRASTETRVIK